MTIQALHDLVHQFNAQEQLLICYSLKRTKDDTGENKYLQLFEFLIPKKKICFKGRCFSGNI